jgi:hypothetical protein
LDSAVSAVACGAVTVIVVEALAEPPVPVQVTVYVSDPALFGVLV